MMTFNTTTEETGVRLDVYLAAQLPRLSRAFIRKLSDGEKVTVNGEHEKAGYKLKGEEKITVDYKLANLDKIPAIGLPVIYEDIDCLVVDKPAGILSHAISDLYSEATVASFLRQHASHMEGDRAGIVHRLDRATSGVMICAKNQAALSWLQKQFATRKAEKVYVALVEGHLKQKHAIIDMPLRRDPKNPKLFHVHPHGKPAISEYTVLQPIGQNDLVEVRPKTGRTHQLRVHFAKLGHPIVGDNLYGHGGTRLFLHAHSLTIRLPNKATQTFTSAVPKGFT